MFMLLFVNLFAFLFKNIGFHLQLQLQVNIQQSHRVDWVNWFKSFSFAKCNGVIN